MASHDDVPMLHLPDRLPGERDQILSPNDFMALTNQAGDPTQLGDDWGLHEVSIDTIDKNGFQLHGTAYAASELIPYTTGDKKGPRPRLVARYDRAQAARGVLREVKVLEVLEGGAYRPVCVAVPREQLKHDTASRAEFLAFRREYLRVLTRKRNLTEREIQAHREQERELKAFFDEQSAHARRKLKLERGVSARATVYGEAEQRGKKEAARRKQERVGKALQQADLAAIEENSSKTDEVESAPGATGRHRHSSTVLSAEEKSGRIGTALGGKSGFVNDEDET